MKDELNYDSILDNWHDKVTEKADKFYKMADDCDFGTNAFYKYRAYADALYMSLAMLSNEERIAKRRLRSKKEK